MGLPIAQRQRRRPWLAAFLTQALIAIVALFDALPVAALGLGELRNQSALNQPFYAEIDLFDIDERALDSVKVSLASRSAFEQAGIERPHFLTGLQFTPMLGPSGEPMVQVSTREPVREPYLDLLVEVVWPNGRIVKEYSVLLDPPSVGGSRSVSAAPRRIDQAVQSPFAAAAEGGSSTHVEIETRVTDVESPGEAADLDFPISYGPVPPGAGLAMIARRLAPLGATLEQTAMALYRNSQDAFINGDINRLRVGAELEIPTAAALFALEAQAARKQYRAALAGRPAVKAPLTDVDARLTIATPETIELDDADGEVGDNQSAEETEADLEEAGSAAVTETVTSLGSTSELGSGMTSGARAAADASLEAELLLMREVSEANRQEAGELRTRVQELEAQLDDIARLLELRNAQLASLATEALADRTRGLEPGPKSDSESGTESGAEAALVPSASQAVSEDHAAAAAAGDAGPETEDEVPGFDLLAMVSAWRQAILSWALPLLAVTLFLALLGLILHRRRQQSTAFAAANLVDVEGRQDGSRGGSFDDLQLDPEWPTAAALNATKADVTAPIMATDDVLVTAVDLHPALTQGDRRQEEVLTSGLARAEDSATKQEQLRQGLPDREGVTPDQELVGQRPATPGGPPVDESRAGPSLAEQSQGELSLDQGPEPGFDEQPVDLGQVVEQRRQPASAALAPVAAQSKGSQAGHAAVTEPDGLAEAEVYLTYGRYRDAERGLRETIAAVGESPELRYKLAEIYLAAGDLAALASLADEMRLADEAEPDSERWTRIENALAKKTPASESNTVEAADGIDDAAVDDEEGLFLDLEDLEQEVGEVTPITTSQQPSKPEPDSKARSLDGLAASSSAGDFQWPILAKLPDEDADSGDPTQTQSLTQVDAESDPELSITALPAADQDDLDQSPTAVSTEGPADERWPLEAGEGWDEIELKLDLARAYLDMDDPDAARTILKEVVAEGRDEQRHEAESLLAGLG